MSDAPSKDSPSPSASPARPPRRWLRRIAALLLLPVIGVMAAPYIAAMAPFRDWLLGAALAELNGTVRSSGATFDWFRPVALYGLEIRPPAGPPVLVVPAVEGDTPLWRLILDRKNLGVFRIDHPQLEIALRERSSTVKDLLAKVDKSQNPSHPDNADKLAGGATLGIDLIDATLTVRREGSDVSWGAKNIRLSARVQRAQAGHERELVVAPGRVLDHIAITPEVCDDFLKFMAPTLAKVTRAGGAFSLDLEECRVPLDLPRQGDVVGRLTLHEIKAGPGPMVEQVATLFGLPDANQLASEQVVFFQLKDERVYHKDLTFKVGPMGIGTEGYVNLPDQALDLTLGVRLPEFANRTAPLRGALSGESLSLPIRGTLARPELDRSVLRDSGLGVLSGVLDSLIRGQKISPEAIQRGLREGRLMDQKPNDAAPEVDGEIAEQSPDPNGAAGKEGASPAFPRDAAAQAIPLVEELLRQRAETVRQRRAAAAANAAEPPAPGFESPADPAPPAGQRPLRRRARQLIDTLKQPPPAENKP